MDECIVRSSLLYFSMPRKKNIVKRKDLVIPDFARYFFVLAILGVLLLFLWVISPFFNVLIYSALIAVVFYPIDAFFEKKMKGHKTLSAFLTMLIVLLLLLVPLTLFLIFIAQEAVDAYKILELKLQILNIESWNFGKLAEFPFIGESLTNLAERYGFTDFLQRVDVNMVQMLEDGFSKASDFIFEQGAGIVIRFGDTVVNLFILLLTTFFFFRDGSEVTKFIEHLSPLPQEYEDSIEKKLKDTTYGVVVGNFGTAILQGFVGGIGFAIAGVENAIFWGTIMAFASLIPYIGASIIWGPVAIVLLAQGNLALGGFLIVWGLLLVSAVDNIVRPYLIGSSAKMHPLATFLVVLGGVFIFGLKGIIFGPLILSLMVTVLHIYKLEYKDILK